MMKQVEFEARFDNGHDFYEIVSYVDVDIEEELTDELVQDLVQEMKRAEKRKHGKSYRGEVVGISITFDEQDEAVENGWAKYDENDDFVVLDESKKYLSWWIDKQVIEKAFANED